MASISESIRILAGLDGKELVEIMPGTVESVDEDARLCSVLAITTGHEVLLEEVQLSATPNDGMIPIPEVDSDVVVAFTPKSGRFLLMTSDLDKWLLIIDKDNEVAFSKDGWVWNDGKNDGLAIVGELTKKYNALEDKVNLIISTIGAAGVAPTDGGAAFKASLISGIGAPLKRTVKTEIENKSVKH